MASAAAGSFLVAIGFQVLHQLVAHFLVSKLEKSTSLYGSLGATTTFLFFMYMTSLLVVIAPVLNSSLYEELLTRREAAADASEVGALRRMRHGRTDGSTFDLQPSNALPRVYTRAMAMDIDVQRLELAMWC